MTEPIYEEDSVNLGYLNKRLEEVSEDINIPDNISRHYASKPKPPYYKGDTWIDGTIVHTCINTRLIGLYSDDDWVSESGAKKEAERKNKTYLTQPSNYNAGDMWILQSDDDHKAGKKGEILISTAGRREYDEGDWVNMLGYGTIRSINEVSENLNNAINRIGNVEEAIEDGIIITFYQDTEPEAKHTGDLWYVTGEVEGYTQGKIYRYDGTEWKILDDPAIQKAFDEANEARIVADGKIQSFYSDTEPTKGVGVGDLWIDLANNNQLYRYNGTKWVAVYDTRINELVVNVESVTERVATVETDLGEIDLKVKETTTKITTIEGDVKNITNTTSTAEGKNIHLTDSAEEPLVDIRLHGETSQATRSGKNLFDYANSEMYINSGFNKTKEIIDGRECYTVECITTSSTLALVKEKDAFWNKLENGKTYIFSFYVKASEQTSGGERIYINQQFCTTSNYTITTQWKRKSYTFTFDSSKSTNVIHFYPSLTSGKIVYYADFQIEEGTEVTPYESYGASPSPEFPSKIENVEGKNLWNNELEIAEYDETGNKITTYVWAVNKNAINVKPNTTYTVSQKETPTHYRIIYFKDDTYLTRISNTQNTSTGYKSYTFTTPENCNKIYIQFRSTIEVIATGSYNMSADSLTNIQLEEGTVATEYVPYNSLGVKVTGKNLFDFSKIIYKTSESRISITGTEDNFTLSSSAGAVGNISDYVIWNLGKVNSDFIYYSFNTDVTDLNTGLGVIYASSDGTYESRKSLIAITRSTKTGKVDFTEYKGQYLLFMLRTNTPVYSSQTITNLIITNSEKDLEEYEPYKEQIVYFPLSEGQKLMEGSYLADDGVHNVRGQTILPETTKLTTATVFGTQCKFATFVVPNAKNVGRSYDFVSDKISPANEVFGEYTAYRNQTYFYVLTTAEDTLENFNSKIAGSIVEYELAEEEIIPYTEEQQEAWNKIRALITYKNVTNISFDAYAKIAYMRDNGLDVYETKQNADKRYIETTEKFAEHKITVDGVKTQVSETEKRLTNDYLTAEQVNAEIGGTKEDIDILKQKQASTELTTEEFKIQFDKINNEGVSKVKTSMGYTFNDEGMHVNKDGAETGTIVDEAGVSVLDKTGSQDAKLLYAGYVKEGDTDFPDYIGQTIVASANMIVQKYLVVGTNTRFEDYVNPELGGKGTGAFEI